MRLDSLRTILVLGLITCGLVLYDVPSSTWVTTATASLVSGCIALVLMAASCVLGSRWRVVERAFGGLDRVYETHKWLGVWALVLASFHLVFKANLAEWGDIVPIWELSKYNTRLVRQLSFVALMFIVVLALNRNIAYNQWRWWHKLSGPLFLIVIAHWLSFKSPIALASPAGLWLAAVSASGVCAVVYKLLLYPVLARHAEYVVDRVSRGGGALRLGLSPLGKPLRYQPGQFAFLSLKERGLREPHPFTIASGGGDEVEFVIRSLGDYTGKLAEQARPGMHAEIYAPYGRFRRLETKAPEIWIGGGVGISPFLSWLQDEEPVDSGAVTLFYFYSQGRDFPDVETVGDLAAGRSVEFIANTTGPRDPGFVRRFEEIVEASDSNQLQISFCGPKGLLKRVREMMHGLGVPEGNLRHELFEFR